jgi:hypothetical protein
MRCVSLSVEGFGEPDKPQMVSAVYQRQGQNALLTLNLTVKTNWVPVNNFEEASGYPFTARFVISGEAVLFNGKKSFTVLKLTGGNLCYDGGLGYDWLWTKYPTEKKEAVQALIEGAVTDFKRRARREAWGAVLKANEDARAQEKREEERDLNDWNLF